MALLQKAIVSPYRCKLAVYGGFAAVLVFEFQKVGYYIGIYGTTKRVCAPEGQKLLKMLYISYLGIGCIVCRFLFCCQVISELFFFHPVISCYFSILLHEIYFNEKLVEICRIIRIISCESPTAPA